MMLLELLLYSGWKLSYLAVMHEMPSRQDTLPLVASASLMLEMRSPTSISKLAIGVRQHAVSATAQYCVMHRCI